MFNIWPYFIKISTDHHLLSNVIYWVKIPFSCRPPACSGFLHLFLQVRNKCRILMSFYFPPGPRWANRQAKTPGPALSPLAPTLPPTPLLSGQEPPLRSLAHQRCSVVISECCGRTSALNRHLRCSGPKPC